MSEYLLTPVGRIVQGHPMVGNDKDMEGRPLTFADGSPRKNYFFALAISKTDPGWQDIWDKIIAIAVADFPGGQSQQAGFAWKVGDGDSPDNAEKEGFPGHWVMRMSTSYIPQVYTAGGAEQIVDMRHFKRGDYARAYVKVAGNGSTVKPGIFINPSMVEIVGYGEEIKSGPDAGQVFGTAATTLPPGASSTPVAGGAPLAGPGAPGQAPTAAPGQAPAGPVPGQAPAGPVPGQAPTTQAGPGAPGQAPTVEQAAAFLRPDQQAPVTGSDVPLYQMTEKANGYTREQLINEHGWTDTQLIADGLMI